MSKGKTIGIVLIGIVAGALFFTIPTILLYNPTAEALVDENVDINVKLQEKYFKEEISDGLKGLGQDDGDTFPDDVDEQPIENCMLLAALYTRYSRVGNDECDTWAEESVLPAISSLEDGDKLQREENVFYTVDQGVALEFLSVGYDRSQNQELLFLMEKIYSSLDNFEANDTLGQYGYEGAYWRAIDDKGIKYNQGELYYDRCLTNASLWIVIGALKFGITVKGLTIDADHEYSKTSIDIAEKTIEFVEDHCFHNGTGFTEFPYTNYLHQEYRLNTQILGVLAYTRLYEATGKQIYLDKANNLVQYIINLNFLDTGDAGGCVELISRKTGTKSDVKRGYDNALLIYALVSLYVASGEVYAHLQRAEEIAGFMNDELFDESSNGQIVGYYERLIDDELPNDATKIYYKTNALMMLVNEEIGWYERPWYIKYIWFIIIGAIILISIIVIVILVQRKQDVGRKLPKLVKGLVED